MRLISYTVIITGGKGGVGKSLIAATAALILSTSSSKVGLLDLDLHGPSASIILGVGGAPVESEEGLTPPTVDCLEVMSLDLLAKGRPLPLRGESKEEVVKEVLALTAFGSLDYLVVDLPPGTGDELLTVSKYARQSGGAIVVTTPTKLSIAVAAKVVEILASMSMPILGLVENMAIGQADSLSETLARETGVKFLGRIPFDPAIFSDAGRLSRNELLNTRFAASLRSALMNAGFKVE